LLKQGGGQPSTTAFGHKQMIRLRRFWAQFGHRKRKLPKNRKTRF